MNTKKYNFIIYIISVTIVATITVQFFWNYKNYQSNKQRIINEVQLSFDNAIEEYYSTIAKKDFFKLINAKKIKKTTRYITSSKKEEQLFSNQKKRLGQSTDSLYTIHKRINNDQVITNFFRARKLVDTLKLRTNLKPILISFLEESIDYKRLDSLIQRQLLKKGIEIENSFYHIKNDSIFKKTKDTLVAKIILNTTAKSTYTRNNEQFKLFYENPKLITLKRGFTGILLSFLLSFTIIFCLFFLLKIIKKQKELAFIKNDLISNITHEFKTPIATVNTAIEAITNFNTTNDKEKTKKYLNISSFQLAKLNQMVEKLLETATLDSEQLLLKKENVDIVAITEKIVNKFILLSSNKEINFTTNLKAIYVSIDVFHFENVLSNLIDNAIKYGGNQIEVNINSILNATQILVVDNGGSIDKKHQEMLFDKFYRVPKGNTHNVKGFGIGLYYCKQIIEKHKGKITLLVNKSETIFKIHLPNE
jgi:two-component system phosphate regulon sensor histidine kinase PhoR